MRTPTLLTFAVLAMCATQAHAVPQSAAATLEMDAPAAEADEAPRKRSILVLRDVPAPDQDISKDSCLRFTGSRLMRDDRPNQRCAHAAGYVLMREDLDLAGAGSLADFVR
jgi:hypothetical protein